jgi:hypothetical protein
MFGRALCRSSVSSCWYSLSQSMQRTGAHDGKWNAAAAIPNMVVGLATAVPVWTSRLVLSKVTLTAAASVAPRQR